MGRLSELTDASGNLIESYAYDPAGNVISETKGNGTSTTLPVQRRRRRHPDHEPRARRVDQLADDVRL